MSWNIGDIVYQVTYTDNQPYSWWVSNPKDSVETVLLNLRKSEFAVKDCTPSHRIVKIISSDKKTKLVTMEDLSNGEQVELILGAVKPS